MKLKSTIPLRRALCGDADGARNIFGDESVERKRRLSADVGASYQRICN